MTREQVALKVVEPIAEAMKASLKDECLAHMRNGHEGFDDALSAALKHDLLDQIIIELRIKIGDENE